MRPLLAGLAYFVLVLAAGFVLGVLRGFALAPAVGELAAVALELPVMLAWSWVVCRVLARRLEVDATLDARIQMGSLALVLLLAAELALARWLAGSSPAEFVASATEPARILGLCGQLCFAAWPVVQLRVGAP